MGAGAMRNMAIDEPGRLRAGVLTILVHVVFLVLLVFGLDWKKPQQEGMVVDLWTDLPQPELSKPMQQPKQPPKPVEPKPAPEPIKETPPPIKKPSAPLKQKPEPPKPVEETKPDPDVKKKEQERREAEIKAKEKTQREAEIKLKEQQKLEAEKKAREQEKLEAERKVKEQEKQEAERKAKEKAEAERKQRELEAQQRREREAKEQLAAQQAAARARIASEIDKYKAMILAKIKSRIVMPPDLPGNPVVEFNVTLLPGGDILDVRLRKSSGYATFDSAVERAIHLSQPLPLPPDPALFNEFRRLNVTVHYLE